MITKILFAAPLLCLVYDYDDRICEGVLRWVFPKCTQELVIHGGNDFKTLNHSLDNFFTSIEHMGYDEFHLASSLIKFSRMEITYFSEPMCRRFLMILDYCTFMRESVSLGNLIVLLDVSLKDGSETLCPQILERIIYCRNQRHNGTTHYKLATSFNSTFRSLNC
jgi:hypothetical protein